MAYKTKRTHTEKWRRCVYKVKKQDSRVNPFAVCTSSLGSKSFKK